MTMTGNDRENENRKKVGVRFVNRNEIYLPLPCQMKVEAKAPGETDFSLRPARKFSLPSAQKRKP